MHREVVLVYDLWLYRKGALEACEKDSIEVSAL